MDTLGHGKFSRVFFRAEQGAELAVAQIKPVLRGLSRFAQFVLVSNPTKAEQFTSMGAPPDRSTRARSLAGLEAVISPHHALKP